MLLLPVPLAIWPPLVCAVTLIYGIGLALIMPFICVFNESENLWYGGLTKAYINCVKYIK